MIISSAKTVVQQDAPDVVTLVVADSEESEPYAYALYKMDPYGNAPILREQLQKMVDAGELVIEGGLPDEWPWWEAPPEVEEDAGP